MRDRIRELVREHARLAVPAESLRDDADLYEAGMTSHASVGVMVALEEAFGVEFPDRMLRRRTFESVEAIHAALAELVGGATVDA